MKFKSWLEAIYSDDLSQLKGEPYMKVEWRTAKSPKGPFKELSIRYIWEGYPILPHQKSYALPGEFASLSLGEDDKQPGYFYVDGVDVAQPFRRRGYATEMYNRALGLIKQQGYKGIISYKPRTGGEDIDAFWGKAATRSTNEADYLEDNRLFQQFHKRAG